MRDINRYSIGSAIKQTEQVNGFYHVSFDLKQTVPIEDLLGRMLILEKIDNNGNNYTANVHLSLFLMPSNLSVSYQFLSSDPISKEWLDCISENDQFVLTTSSVLTSPITIPADDKPCVILADATLLANAFALAKVRQHAPAKTVVFLHAKRFPFMPKPARFWAPEMPDEAIGASSLLEDWGIINRLASDELIAGCFQGNLSTLYQEWAQHIDNIDDWQTITLVD